MNTPIRTSPTGTADDPYGDALALLKAWKDFWQITLTREHVYTAARWTGAKPELLFDIIYGPTATA